MRKEVSALDKIPTGVCGMCRELKLFEEEDTIAFNALCRRDNSTYICSSCGDYEGMEDIGGIPYPWERPIYWEPYGTELTGNIAEVKRFMNAFIEDVDLNWVTGMTRGGKYKVGMKVSKNPSDEGINGGRIRKLWVREMDSKPSLEPRDLMAYNRGWEVDPDTPDMKLLLKNLLRALDSGAPMGSPE